MTSRLFAEFIFLILYNIRYSYFDIRINDRFPFELVSAARNFAL